MGACAVASYCGEVICWESDNYVGHKIFLPLNTDINVSTDDTELNVIINQCKSELIESERIRKDLADKFEIMLVETGACVLKKPTFERSIISFVVLIIINIKMCANAKGADISQLNISSLFSFSMKPPFFSVNQVEIDKLKTLTGFDMESNNTIKQCKDAIIDFLQSLSKLNKMITEQKSLIENSFTHLRRKFTQIKEIKKLDYEKNKIIYEQMMASKNSFNFCFDILSEMTTNIIEIDNKLVSPKKMKLWMMIADDAIKRKITDPKQIVFYYAKGKKAKSVNEWKENITYKVVDEELEY